MLHIYIASVASEISSTHPLFACFPSFPRSAWERKASRSAARTLNCSVSDMPRTAERCDVRSHAERGNEGKLVPSFPRSAWEGKASRSAARTLNCSVSDRPRTAERCDGRSHAERGNEGKRGQTSSLVPTLCVGTQGQPLCGAYSELLRVR